MKSNQPIIFHASNVRRREKEGRKVLFSLQFGPSSKNLPFSPRNQKNFHIHQERKITRRLRGARISSWIQEIEAGGERKSS